MGTDTVLGIIHGLLEILFLSRAKLRQRLSC